MSRNWYEVLGVDRNDTEEGVKEKYYALVKKYNPDSFSAPKEKENANEKMKEINLAFEQFKKNPQQIRDIPPHKPEPSNPKSTIDPDIFGRVFDGFFNRK